jgi:hypothetical protein
LQPFVLSNVTWIQLLSNISISSSIRLFTFVFTCFGVTWLFTCKSRIFTSVTWIQYNKSSPILSILSWQWKWFIPRNVSILNKQRWNCKCDVSWNVTLFNWRKWKYWRFGYESWIYTYKSCTCWNSEITRVCSDFSTSGKEMRFKEWKVLKMGFGFDWIRWGK